MTVRPDLAEVERTRDSLHPMPSDTSAFIDSLLAALKAERERAEKMEAALRHVRAIVVDGAAEGFHYARGDWAERLFASQSITLAALGGRT